VNPLLRRSAAHAFVTSVETPVLDDNDRHHLQRVLRLRAGEAVTVSDGRGSWRPCRMGTDGDVQPDGDVLTDAAPAAVTIGVTIPKGDRPEWIVQKLTEIGVARIVVLHADRSVITWTDDRAERHLDKLRRVAREAAMQSRRTWLPAVSGPLTLRALLADVPVGVALAEPDAAPPTAADTTILIGPEGGWSVDELALCPRHVVLGTSILRVETAALVAATRLVTLLAEGAR